MNGQQCILVANTLWDVTAIFKLIFQTILSKATIKPSIYLRVNKMS